VVRVRLVACLIATANTHEARRLAHRTLLLMDGAIVEAGPTAEFFESPAESRTRAFLAGELVYQPPPRFASRNASISGNDS
jgi:tungstate transport system ATP-binding protein